MQTFDLDLSVKRVIPLLYVKQRDVGAKIAVNITDNGTEYAIPADVSFSVWYSGKSGEGNYTEIDGRSAFDIDGNTVTAELIYQMLNNPGAHLMCLVMNGKDGAQIGLWNIPYFVEAIPGADSEGAKQYYQAFLQAQKRAEEAANRAEKAAEIAGELGGFAETTEYELNQIKNETINARHYAEVAQSHAEDAAARAEEVVSSVDNVTLEHMRELITGAENLSADAAAAAKRAEEAAEDAEDSAYNKQNKLAWATDEDIDAMFDGTYIGVENEDPEGDGYLPGEGGGGDGKSAYEIALDHGFDGTEEEWLESLKGEKGDPGKDGVPGADGYTPVKGQDYYTEAEKAEMVNAVLAALPIYDGSTSNDGEWDDI